MRDIDVATTFATGATQIAVGDYRCCIQAKEYSGTPGDFASSVTRNARPPRRAE
jgi:hypothetical protein